MKRAPFLCLLLLLVPALAVPAGDVRVMTWNLEDMDLFDGAGGGRVDWQLEAERDIASVIRRVDPDILFVAEAPSLVELEAFVARNNLFYDVIHYRQQAGRRDFADSMAVLHRLEVRGSRFLTPALPESGRSTEAATVDWSYRGVVSVEFTGLTLLGVHLKSPWDGRERSYRLRDNQARSLLALVDGYTGPLVVLGDFNDSPGQDDREQTFEVADTIGLLESNLLRAAGAETTQEKGFNLDHIFVLNAAVGPRHVVDSDWRLSDHRPVWADIRY